MPDSGGHRGERGDLSSVAACFADCATDASEAGNTSGGGGRADPHLAPGGDRGTDSRAGLLSELGADLTLVHGAGEVRA